MTLKLFLNLPEEFSPLPAFRLGEQERIVINVSRVINNFLNIKLSGFLDYIELLA
jgi:hypothetical protein